MPDAKQDNPAAANPTPPGTDPTDPNASPAPIADPKDFERSMLELEALVDRLEQGDLSLEESLAAFEQGIRLTRGCQRALDSAEQRVRILTERSATAEPEPFTPEHD
jgi:exodeoxyribonuclease VII small subunit